MLNSTVRFCIGVSAVSALVACAARPTSASSGDARDGGAAAAAVEQADTPDAGAQAKEVLNSIGMKLVLVPKGTFAMGTARGNPNNDGDERQHEVTITRDYYLGAFEVTQEQFKRVMERNPSQFQGAKVPGGGANHPVERVSWNDAVEFCRRLSELPEEKAAGRVYCLPTEAEWERACRAGNPGEYAFGDQVALLGDYCWYAPNGGSSTHPVGQKKPNAWGLYDMHGNAWEWVADWYEPFSSRAVVDPTGPVQGTDRVYRGGSWQYSEGYVRSANRTATRPEFASEGFDFLSISFRVAMGVPGGR